MSSLIRVFNVCTFPTKHPMAENPGTLRYTISYLSGKKKGKPCTTWFHNHLYTRFTTRKPALTSNYNQFVWSQYFGHLNFWINRLQHLFVVSQYFKTNKQNKQRSTSGCAVAELMLAFMCFVLQGGSFFMMPACIL